MFILTATLGSLVISASVSLTAGTEPATELISQAKKAMSHGDAKQALTLADKAIAQEPANPQAYLFRGTLNEYLNRHMEAIADFSKTIELDPKLAEAFNRRGSEQFKFGKIAESIADFDKFLALKPAEEPGHWKRGISYYYAGRYEDGRKQFEGYEKVDTNDVENAVWRYLCMAKAEGRDKARTAILKIGQDKRVPMMTVYELFAGRAQPEEVLTAARNGMPSPAELNQRLFYAHLYLGLYFDANGDKQKAVEHLAQATDDHKIGHYMWDVARVHLDLLRKKQP
jgi:lipoprotein NlpI